MRGIWTALITPFDRNGEIDWKAFRTLLQDQKDAKVAGVIPCGTTGESPVLTLDEKKRLIETTLEECKGSSIGVFAGTGSNNTAETIAFSKWASDQGVQGCLIVTPYYNKPSQAGLLAHFHAVADAVNCEIMVYNVPGRSGVALTADTIAKLARHPRIRSLKEASGNVAFTTEVRDAMKTEGTSLDILSGDDVTFLPLLAIGATGVVSVGSNLFPRALVALQKAHESGSSEALAIHEKFFPLFRDLFVESNPAPIKAAMATAFGFNDSLRPPLAPLSEGSRKRLETSLAQCGIKPGARL